MKSGKESHQNAANCHQLRINSLNLNSFSVKVRTTLLNLTLNITDINHNQAKLMANENFAHLTIYFCISINPSSGSRGKKPT